MSELLFRPIFAPDAIREAVGGRAWLQALLDFGSLALIATPLLDNRTRSARDDFAGGLDRMSTGSVGSRGSVGSTGSTGRRDTYTLRRSVLQPLPTSICVIRENGQRSGDC